MGHFKDQLVLLAEKMKEESISNLRRDYLPEIIVEAAARIIADEMLNGKHEALCDFEAMISGIVGGQSLPLDEVRANG